MCVCVCVRVCMRACMCVPFVARRTGEESKGSTEEGFQNQDC